MASTAPASPSSTAPADAAVVRLNRRPRVPTATSRFGVSRRENHDASEFYERFPTPVLSRDDQVNPPAAVDEIWAGDARDMDRHGQVADASVALVVTSPPYYAGKEYETAIGEGHVPASYIAYLEMLAGVFGECARKLEPGGRIAVNVANLGRKPYRSLSADVSRILEELGLLLRGEIVWIKGRAAGGSCAWGSFQRPGNPVLRDVTERIVVASKGRFERAHGARARAEGQLPSVATISADEFMDLTTDVWEFLPESATRVGHPAPFPVELPRRLIDLYTYQGDLVLDPFIGSGSTAVAAVRTGRAFVGFDTEPEYVAQARARVAAERERLPRSTSSTGQPSEPGTTIALNGVGSAGEPGAPGRSKVRGSRRAPADDGSVPLVEVRLLPIGQSPLRAGDDAGDGPGLGAAAGLAQARREGRKATDVARLMLEGAGFVDIEAKVRLRGVPVDFRARDQRGGVWHFDVVGRFANGQPGLRRTETLWKAVGKASLLKAAHPDLRLVLLTTAFPSPGPGAKALQALCGTGSDQPILDVVRLLDEPDGSARLHAHAMGDQPRD